jgi:hypothetical protein
MTGAEYNRHLSMNKKLARWKRWQEWAAKQLVSEYGTCDEWQEAQP